MLLCSIKPGWALRRPAPLAHQFDDDHLPTWLVLFESRASVSSGSCTRFDHNLYSSCVLDRHEIANPYGKAVNRDDCGHDI